MFKGHTTYSVSGRQVQNNVPNDEVQVKPSAHEMECSSEVDSVDKILVLEQEIVTIENESSEGRTNGIGNVTSCYPMLCNLR